jgi:hypothetical protein
MLRPEVAAALKAAGVTDPLVRRYLETHEPESVSAAIAALELGLTELAVERRRDEGRASQRPTVEAGLRQAELAVALRTSRELERARASTELLRRRRDEARLVADEVMVRLQRFRATAERRHADATASEDTAADQDDGDVESLPGIRALKDAIAAHHQARHYTDAIGQN